jgi:hypothetical protein
VRARRSITSRRARVVLAVGLCAPAALAISSVAVAAWGTGGSGAATGAAAVMPAGATPSGVAALGVVTVRWPGAPLVAGATVSGYVIRRYDSATGALVTVGAGCSGVVAATSCTELSVPAGAWVYTDTPVLASWTGVESPASVPVTVP